MASSDNEDYDYTSGDEDYGYGEEEDDDVSCCQSDDGDYGDECLELEEEEEEEGSGKVVRDSKEERTHALETEDKVRERQDAAVEAITNLLLVPRGYAAALLRVCQWDPEQFRDEWFDADNGRRLYGVIIAAPTTLNDRDLTCAICFDAYGPGAMRSATCAAHFYCHECWRGYIHAAVGDGPRCLSLRCPHPGCPAAVVRELVDDVAEEHDRQRYATFVVRSFVEEGKSKLVRWCPGPGCARAVRSTVGLNLYEVLCECKHGFCFRCGEEAHRPSSCETTREWIAKNSSDGETVNWVLANTKHCPKCRRAIEKNQGCMHMTCSAPCRYEFCWLCLGPWKDHGNEYYSCSRYDKEGIGKPDQRKEQAKASLERYLHYYERWSAYGDARKKARADLDGLEAGGTEAFADAFDRPMNKEMEFIQEAYAQIIECRRVLRWTYAYVYYMDQERHGTKLSFIEHQLTDAERALEKLHGCAEKEREGLFREAESGQRAPHELQQMYHAYREKLVDLNSIMRNYFNNLAKGFEDGMPEVVA
ncbi:hypothetical protein PR202_gb23297 [Eleusine coracana subsp. coracana]|uniref:RBR-type E3 ubiquitin transferase n=1 Tax=Eleusine coracana subsp. coracana TaxID=191504 RepID=A0AAV5FJ29_ELECO|nr:hypothetical protein PR202_gb23297 [Eleusine coracana subsp. coracana]